MSEPPACHLLRALVPLAAAERQAWARAHSALGRSCQRFPHSWVTIWVLLRAKAFDWGKGLVRLQLWCGGVNAQLSGLGEPIFWAADPRCADQHGARQGAWAPSCSHPRKPLEPIPQPLALLRAPCVSVPFRQIWHAVSQQTSCAERWETGNPMETNLWASSGPQQYRGNAPLCWWIFFGAQNCLFISSEMYR